MRALDWQSRDNLDHNVQRLFTIWTFAVQEKELKLIFATVSRQNKRPSQRNEDTNTQSPKCDYQCFSKGVPYLPVYFLEGHFDLLSFMSLVGSWHKTKKNVKLLGYQDFELLIWSESWSSSQILR